MEVLEFTLNRKNTVKIRNGKVAGITFSMDIKELSNSFMVNIPAFNIHFTTPDKSKIEKLALRSFSSFFNFWLENKGEKELIKHMIDLGFTVSKKQKIASGYTIVKKKKTRGSKSKRTGHFDANQLASV